MGKLKDLFDKLNDAEHCRYNDNGRYPVLEENKIINLKPIELLEVGRTYPSREHIIIACFGDNPTRVQYFGEDVALMKNTLKNLKLPNSWPSNLGEKVFYLFKGHLNDVASGSISLEQQVIPGKEHQFEMVLKKFTEIYKASESNIGL
jgi:hypothetical protein